MFIFSLFQIYNFFIAIHKQTVHIFKYKDKSLRLFIMLILTKKCNIVNNYIDIFPLVFKKWRYMCLLQLMSRLRVCLLLLAFEGVRMRRAKPKQKGKKKEDETESNLTNNNNWYPSQQCQPSFALQEKIQFGHER